MLLIFKLYAPASTAILAEYNATSHSSTLSLTSALLGATENEWRAGGHLADSILVWSKQIMALSGILHGPFFVFWMAIRFGNQSTSMYEHER